MAEVPGVRVRVGTYNIHHGAGAWGGLDLAHTADAIGHLDIDVVGLQEVDRHWSERSDFADQARLLADRLDMHMVFGECLDRAARGLGRPRRKYGNAFLSRYRILDSGTTRLPCSRGGEQRALLEAEVDVRGIGLRCLVTHLQHRSRGDRLAQAEAIKATIGDVDVRTVLMGDLNARPDTPEVKTLTGHLVDVWPDGGRGMGYTYSAHRPFVRIDYVLASSDIHIHRARVTGSDASDHLAVTADLGLPRGGA